MTTVYAPQSSPAPGAPPTSSRPAIPQSGTHDGATSRDIEHGARVAESCYDVGKVLHAQRQTSRLGPVGGDRALGTAIEPISQLRSFSRRLRVLVSMTRRHPGAALTEDGFRRWVWRLAKDVSRTDDPLTTARFLWAIENLSFHYLLDHPRWPRFSDPCWPPEAMPTSHSGLGMAAALTTRFDPEGMSERIERTAAPGFEQFAWEAVGALLASLTEPSFRSVVRVARALRLAHLPEILRPRSSALDGLSPSQRRLAAHGHGRFLYFRNYRVRSAVSTANELPPEERQPAIRGVVAALTLVNAGELASALRFGEGLAGTGLLAAVDEGAINALTLLLWTQKRSLDGLEKPSPRTLGLLLRARANCADAGGEGPRFLLG